MKKAEQLARQRMKETGPPDLNCRHDGAYFLQEGVPLRYCPQCSLLTTGTFGKYSLYMHPGVLADLAKIEAREPIEWGVLYQALAELAVKGEAAGEPLSNV